MERRQRQQRKQQQPEAGANTEQVGRLTIESRATRVMAATLPATARLALLPRWNAEPQWRVRPTTPTATPRSGPPRRPRLSVFALALFERASSRARRQAPLPRAAAARWAR